MLGHLLGFFLIQFVPPIETEEMTLEPECIEMNQLALTVDGEVDPCTINKLHTFYDKSIQCQLSCRLRESPNTAFTRFDGTFHGKTSTFPAGKGLKIQFEPGYCSPDLGKCFANCSDPQLRKVLNKQHDGYKAKMRLNYWFLTFLWVCGGITAGGVMTFQDAICHQVLTSHNSKEHYGHQRLFASLGWGTAAFIVGYWVDRNSAQSLLFDYSVAFQIMFLAWSMDILVVGYLEVRELNLILFSVGYFLFYFQADLSSLFSNHQWSFISTRFLRTDPISFYCIMCFLNYATLILDNSLVHLPKR